MKIVILAGGAGTRLWPLSRKNFPKQFIPLFDSSSLFQMTLERFLESYLPNDLLIVTSQEHLWLAKKQAEEVDPKLVSRIAAEPASRSTAPAILHAIKWFEIHKEVFETLLVVPSDHLISPVAPFLEKLVEAETLAKRGSTVLFGINPTSPNTGYGYIVCKKSAPSEVEQFIEKPPLSKAQKLLHSGRAFWNAGIFLFSAKKLLDDFAKFQPEMFVAYRGDFDSAYANLPNLSIDHALLEECDSLKMIPLQLTWSDVGTWDAFCELKEKDDNGNDFQGDVIDVDVKKCSVIASKKVVGIVGLEDVIVVDSDDALLIAKRGSTQKVRSVVDQLIQTGQDEAVVHPRVERPWGSYTVLEVGAGYKIKRIEVEPGGMLSLQYHHHRSEHWVVVQGHAEITLGEKEHTLSKNESLFVPKKMHHRLHNPTSDLLEIIEVQVGDYVGEDDIVRVEDVYGRADKTIASKI